MAKNKTKKVENDKRAIKINITVSILLVVILSFISVGYALYGQRLGISGTATFKPQGKIAITNVELISSKNVRDGSIPAFTDESVDFNLTFEKAPGSTEPDYQAVYTITIDNDTFYDHEFSISNFQPMITNSQGIDVDPSYLTVSLNGISMGDMIPAGESVTFTLTLDFNPPTDDTYTVGGDLEPELEETPTGNLLATITGATQGDLRESLNHDIATFTIEVMNTFQTSREFTIHVADTSHFKVTNSSGGELNSFTIQSGETNTYTFYVQRVDNAIYTASSLNTGVYIHFSGGDVTAGSISLLVDEQEIEDETPPNVSNVTAVINDATSNDTTNQTVGSVTVSWTGSDAESGVKKYYVVATIGNNSTTYETSDDTPQLTITGLRDGTYTFKVYGENNDEYKPTPDQINSCDTSVCAVSTNNAFDWHYTASLVNSQYMQALTTTEVNRGYNYTTTLRANANTNTYTYTLPNTITVKMGGTTISTGTTAGRYNYNNSSGALTVYGVTGDLVITAVATRSGGGGLCNN